MLSDQLKALREQQRQGALPTVQQQEQEEREQIKQAGIDTYVDVLSEIFGTLFPSEVYRPLLGINEYESKRADFYRLNQAYFAEKVDEIHQQSELALALKDERIKNLTDQAESLNQVIDRMTIEYADLHGDMLQLQRAEDDRVKIVDEYERENIDLRSQVSTLQQKLEEATKPKETKASQTMQAALNEVKRRSQMTADDMIARFNARQKEENRIPTTEVPPFRSEEPSASEPSGDKLLYTEAAEVSQFQVPAVSIPSLDPVQQLVRKTIEERVEALEKAVFGS